jgi:hypothetical protein
MGSWKETVRKSSMDPEARANKHKSTSRRSRTPDPHELLEHFDTLDLRLLQWLLWYPFQRTEDLALATGTRSATIYRHLKKLRNQGIVEGVMPPALGTTTCCLYHLSNLGLHVLAVHEHADPTEMARLWGTDERGLLRLLPRLASLATLQACINGLVADAPEALAYQGHRSEVRWHWMRDYAHRYSYREHVMRCTADAVLFLRVRPAAENGTSVQEQWYGLFLLLDAEIAGDSVLKQRVGRLLCYRESVERWPVYQHFPPVVVLVSTSRRMEHWQWAAREAATALHVVPLSGAIACPPKHQHMASDNPWLFSWKRLGTSGSCTLRDVLHPLPMEAIPPDVLHQKTTMRVMPEESSRDDGRATATNLRKRTQARIVVGNYLHRAHALQKGHMDGRSDEREIKALLALSLGQRHLKLLTLLFTHPLLSVGEIAALLGRAANSIERYLGLLRSQGCIELLISDMGQRWRLSERGLRLLAATQHISIHSIATVEERTGEASLVQRGIDVFLRHLEHTAGIYGFFASVSQAASQEQLQGREHHLLWWETGVVCERRYRDHEYWHNLRPDAMGEYQAGEQHVRFWLEWDRATMGTRDLVAKFRTYAHYTASHTWFKEQRVLPYLLVIVPSKEQEMRIARIVEALLVNIPGLVIQTTTATRLADLGPLAEIWYHVSPNFGRIEKASRRNFFTQ